MNIIVSDNSNTRQDKKMLLDIIDKTQRMLEDAKIKIPNYCPLEISHHYGIDQFRKYGCIIINVINRAYCKKVILLFPGQKNPAHFHKMKEETFQVLNGNMILTINGIDYYLISGELYTIEREMVHSFCSENGCIFEEISTTHNNNDSYYIAHDIATQNLAERKTIITEWQL